jgi:UDP-N-acetylglucosamine pyrophosphorylase
MGLDKAKSLLPVKGADTFLDLTAKQVSQSLTHSIRKSLSQTVCVG